MFEVDEVVVYRKEVYRITEQKRNPSTKEIIYVLTPYHEKKGLVTRLQVPASNKMGYLRKLSTKQEIANLIKRMPTIPLIDGNMRFIENDYRNKLKNANLDDLASIIKTTYLRNKERLEQHKKIGATDDNYFHQAENYLYSEVSAVLSISIDEAKEYIIQQMTK